MTDLCQKLIVRKPLRLDLQVAQQLLNPKGGDVLTLRGSIWLDLRGETRNELFMRPCYVHLLTSIRNYRHPGQLEDDDNGTITLTGTPGQHLSVPHSLLQSN